MRRHEFGDASCLFSQTRSMMIAGAMPPAAHMVTRPRLRSRRSSSSRMVPIRIDPSRPRPRVGSDHDLGAKENLDLLKRDRDDSISRLVVSLDSAKAATILPELDRWANLIRQLGN